MEIQPSEFWEMTLGEVLLEMAARWEAGPEGERHRNLVQWEADATLTREEWWEKYGTA